VWEGIFPGCLLFPVHQPPGGFDAYLGRECAGFDAPRWRAARMVFAPELVATMQQEVTRVLQAEKALYTDDEHGVAEFVVRNRTRHRIAINPFQVYTNDVLTLAPGMSRAFWTRAAATPYSVKAGHHLYRRIFRRYFPRAMSVPVLSGGRLHPLDGRPAWGRVAGWTAKRLQDPAMQRLLWRVGVRSGDYYWEPSALVEEAVLETRASDPDLNRTSILRLQQDRSAHDETDEAARALLFYRQVARRVFTGELSYAGRPASADAVAWTSGTVMGR
jgi:asparagine synthase (glutamine-hydrolysing)